MLKLEATAFNRICAVLCDAEHKAHWTQQQQKIDNKFYVWRTGRERDPVNGEKYDDGNKREKENEADESRIRR